MPEVTDPALLQQLNGGGAPAPAGPQSFTLGTPDPYRATEKQLGIQRDQQQIGISAADAARDADKAARDRREWEATHLPDGSPRPTLPAGYQFGPDGRTAQRVPGLPAAADDSKDASRLATLDSIVGQINRVQQLYDAGIRDENFANLFGALDSWGPEAGRFNSAGQGLADQGLAAFRVPGAGAQSDLEAKQFAMANTPQAGDWDASIEEKLRNIRGRVDANRAALGLPAAEWEGIAPPQIADEERRPIPGALNTPPGGSDRSRNLNEIDGGNGGGTAGYETGATRYEDDPALAGVIAQYQARLARGDSADQINAYLRSAGVTNPGVFDTVAQQVAFRRQNPNVPIGNYNVAALDDRAIPQGVARQVLNAAADSPVGTFITNAGDAATAFNLDSLTSDPALTRAGIEEVNRRNPGSALAGQAAGGTAAALAGQGALMRAGVPALRAGLAADAAYGAASGAGANDENRLLGAGIGAAAGVGGNLAGRGLSAAASRALGGVTDPAVSTLQQADIPLTIGQASGQSGLAGRTIKGLEDRAAGIPGVGDAINARRMEGFQRFNAATFDRALKPIGASVNGAVGEDAVQLAQQAVSDAYTSALAGKAVQADRPFQTQIGQAVGEVFKLPRVGNEVADNVRVILEPYMQGSQLTGDAMQQISRELRGLKAGYAADPLKSRIGTAIDEVEDSVFGLFRRQAPEVLPAYNKARTAARRLYIVEDAVRKAKNADGVFSPAQLGQADRAGMSAYGGKRGAAAGKSPFHDFQRAAQNVLPNKVADSGTAGRLAALAIPGAVAGSGAGIGYAAGDPQTGATGGLALATALALAYTKGGQRALVAAATKRPAAARAAGRAIENATPRIGAATGGATSAIAGRQ